MMIHEKGAFRPARFLRSLPLCMLLLPCACSCLSNEKKPAGKEASISIYPLAELMAKAEAIVVAEVGKKDSTGVPLSILATLKRPEGQFGVRWGVSTTPKPRLNPDVYKRAEELLDKEAKSLVKDPKKDQSTKPATPLRPLYIVPEGRTRLPRAGIQAMFFLWDRIPGLKKDSPLRYRVAHPQCVYDKNYSPTVQAALNNRRMDARRKYLRPWDRRMALRLEKKRDADRIKSLAPGNLERGLRLQVIKVKRALRGDNTFYVGAKFQNARDYSQLIYDGLLAEFGVRLRKKGAPADSTIILRAAMGPVSGALDRQILAIADAGDFTPIKGRSEYTKDLHFDAREHPVLGSLDGPHVLNVFYTSKEDGKKVEHLDKEAWTGTLISPDAEVVFKRKAVADKKE